MNKLVNYYKVFNCKNFLDQNFIELNKEKIGKFIKKLRLKNKMSQYVLADKIKISRQAISKWERGESAPSREILIKLSDIFKVSINEFLGGKMKKENECLTYQEEIELIYNENKDLKTNILKNSNEIKILKDKLLIHDIILIVMFLMFIISVIL